MDYFKSLIETIFSKSNLGFVVFMVINTAPICLLIGQSILYASCMFIVVFSIYFLFVMVIGETIARIMLKAYTRIRLTERTVLSVAFSNAYTIAKRKNPIISNNIKLYVFEGMAIDGYAIGRHTICLSSAALNLPEQDLTTLLLMKFAQFSHHDSEILAVLTAGNIWYIALAIICKWYIYVFGFIVWGIFALMGHGVGGFVLGRFFKALASGTEVVILLFVKAILILGISSYKNNIYINDVFVCDCGYKNNLIRFLQDFEPEQIGQETLFGTINAMKPDKHLRLARIHNYTPFSDRSGAFTIIRRS